MSDDGQHDVVGKAEEWAVNILNKLGIDRDKIPVESLSLTYRPGSFMVATVVIPDLDGVITGSKSKVTIETDKDGEIQNMILGDEDSE